MHILLCRTNQKNMLQRAEDLTFKVYFLLGNPVPDSCRLLQWKWLVLDPMHGTWIFCQKERVRIFLQSNILPKFSKITVTCPKLVKTNKMGQYLLSQSCKMTKNFGLFNVSKMTSLKIYIYISPVIEKLETSNLDSTKPHLKSFIWYSSSRGTVVINS